MTDEELAALRMSCARAVTHHYAPPADAVLNQLAATGAPTRLDAFEARIASELGKPAALYFPTGTMAQQIALRIWCDRARNNGVAFHPTSVLELHEDKAYSMLHGLRALHVATSTRQITVSDVRAIAQSLGAFLFELPQREIGALLPRWNDLVLMCDGARATGAKLHLDGTRLWQAAPYYGRPHKEIADCFDSVYVSFDFGVDDCLGGMLVGDVDFIAEARIWQRRHGGSVHGLGLLALAAERDYDRFVTQMSAFRERARDLAAAFVKLDGVVPNAPHTNTFHVFLRGEKDAIETRAHDYARETGTWIFATVGSTVVPGIQKWEFVVGEATMQLQPDEIVDAVRAVMGQPRREGSRPRARARSKRPLPKRDGLAQFAYRP
ncbi:MAG: hypothetical protein NVS4B5_11830 [Vulcanimicrobiaceae bacterium]